MGQVFPGRKFSNVKKKNKIGECQKKFVRLFSVSINTCIRYLFRINFLCHTINFLHYITLKEDTNNTVNVISTLIESA